MWVFIKHTVNQRQQLCINFYVLEKVFMLCIPLKQTDKYIFVEEGDGSNERTYLFVTLLAICETLQTWW